MLQESLFWWSCSILETYNWCRLLRARKVLFVRLPITLKLISRTRRFSECRNTRSSIRLIKLWLLKTFNRMKTFHKHSFDGYWHSNLNGSPHAWTIQRSARSSMKLSQYVSMCSGKIFIWGLWPKHTTKCRWMHYAKYIEQEFFNHYARSHWIFVDNIPA